MKKLIYCLVLFSCGKYTNMKTHNIDIDKIFQAWNVATSNSIRFEINIVNNERQRSLYENRLEALKSYLEIDDFQTLNNNSIRYKFLKESLKNWNDAFYIIEANESGEQVSIISYILFPNKNDTSTIFKYEYKNNEWVKIDKYIKKNSFEFDKKKYSTTFGKGKNQNDITVTLIQNNQIVNSDFFLFSTMKLLDLK